MELIKEEKGEKFEFVFRKKGLDIEDLRECIEDGLGVEIISIERIYK